jgi:hypothetical protein
MLTGGGPRVGTQVRQIGAELRPFALVIVFGAFVGFLATRSPTLTIGLAAAAGVGCVLTLGSRLTTLFMGLLAALLVGYALFDRAFAYIGVYPVYVSEMVLTVALLHMLVSIRQIRLTWLHWLLMAFMVVGLSRTLPFLGTYGIDALRDAALWGYGFFALAVSIAIRPKHFERIASLYGWMIPVFLVWAPLASLAARLYSGDLPTFLDSGASILSLKNGDLGVHLAGIGAFVIVGLNRARLAGWATEIAIWALWLVGVAVPGSANRGSLLAASTAFIAGAFMLPGLRRVGQFALAAVLALVVAGIAPQIDVASQRSLSVDQLVKNISSVVADTGADELEGTKEWRTQWWGAIIDYTFGGPYFWTGKGFGINLADDDGFQVLDNSALRSPHNSHLTVLARMGVPGLTLWVLLQAGFGASLFWSFVRARRNRATFWCRIDAWLLVYWIAMLVNASFDVYLEGPQGGIWFWSIFGLGLAAIGIQKSAFDELDRAAAPESLGITRLTPNVRDESPAAARAR